MKSFKDFLNEAKKVTIDVDWSPDARREDGLIINARDSLGIIIKPKSNGTALITGKKEDLRKILKHDAYFGYDDDEIEDLYPELN